MDKQPGPVHARQQPDIAGGEAAPGAKQYVAFVEVEALATHIAAAGHALEYAYAAPLAFGVLLDDDRVGARRQRRPREDPGGFSRADVTAKPGSGRNFSDNAQLYRHGRHVLDAYRIAVHRRDRKRRLRSPRGDVLGEDSANPFSDRDLLGRQRLERSEQARQRFFDRNHDSASQFPDLPPDLRNRRRSVTT